MAEDARTKDLTSAPLSFWWAWGLPIIVLGTLNFIAGWIPDLVSVLVAALSLAWMGFACLINARRCGRRHCYYSGPIFLLGSVSVLLIGLGFIPVGQFDLPIIVWATLGLALLTFVSEPILGKYVR